ncbi:chemotaxis protein CheC - inhibitor of MCP methylation [Vibrio maritimus]|uniref:Chemotaxis protein CheC-inhibitor of MCP methylation n=1 Tax=Vibrio maritimus TaxID=990268 RepID=A0A090TVQ3_9VIBR|nr:chemotaxis protein CheC - inhibitor of MCP methylation [Vibrio maritimus]
MFAANGHEAIDIIDTQSIDVVFLDITMPGMDGFEVLEILRQRECRSKVVMVSGDIQEMAQKRCFELGAYAFIQKPLTAEAATPLFDDLHLPFNRPASAGSQFSKAQMFERFQETSNIALGAGAATISTLLKEFIILPVPTVGELSFSELTMMIQDTLTRDNSCAAAQRFVGGGLHGEALVCIEGDSISQVGERLGFSDGDVSNDEVVVNLVNVLVSSFLVSLSEQLCLEFSLREPLRINDFSPDNSMLSDNEHVFTVEYTYDAEALDLFCSVLFMFDEESVDIIRRQMELLQ